jgi:hypothetical protein
VPRSFLINWPAARLAHLCILCTDHPCSNCSENLPGSSFYHFVLNTQTELVLSCSEKNGVYFMFCSCTLSNMPKPTCHAPQRHSSVHRDVYIDFCHVLVMSSSFTKVLHLRSLRYGTSITSTSSQAQAYLIVCTQLYLTVGTQLFLLWLELQETSQITSSLLSANEAAAVRAERCRGKAFPGKEQGARYHRQV